MSWTHENSGERSDTIFPSSRSMSSSIVEKSVVDISQNFFSAFSNLIFFAGKATAKIKYFFMV